jgi:hypothetical protein
MVKARKYRVMGTQRRDNQDLLDLAPEKYDICILINVVNGADTGKISVINHTPSFSIDLSHQPIPHSGMIK